MHLDQVKAQKYTKSLLVVDDRRSNNKLYRVVQVGYSIEQDLFIQVISFDFSLGNFDEGRSNLSDLKLNCVTDMKMRGDLIAILCAEDHTLSIMMIVDGGRLQFYSRSIFKGEVTDNAQIDYSKLVLMRHSSSAYQIYLQTDSDKEGPSLESFEVYIDDGKIQVFHESSEPQS